MWPQWVRPIPATERHTGSIRAISILIGIYRADHIPSHRARQRAEHKAWQVCQTRRVRVSKACFKDIGGYVVFGGSKRVTGWFTGLSNGCTGLFKRYCAHCISVFHKVIHKTL